jgi:hypothetical protein
MKGTFRHNAQVEWLDATQRGVIEVISSNAEEQLQFLVDRVTSMHVPATGAIDT